VQHQHSKRQRCYAIFHLLQHSLIEILEHRPNMLPILEFKRNSKLTPLLIIVLLSVLLPSFLNQQPIVNEPLFRFICTSNSKKISRVNIYSLLYSCFKSFPKSKIFCAVEIVPGLICLASFFI
jgi:hypothetical protein